jgi:hypothetical protein
MLNGLYNVSPITPSRRRRPSQSARGLLVSGLPERLKTSVSI